jgi:uncharacterized membrane protein YvbJ
MNRPFILISLAAAAVVLGACEQSPQDKAASAQKQEQKATVAAAIDKAKEGSKKLAEAATDVAKIAGEEAKTLIQKVKDYLAANNLDSAEEIMAKLRSVRESLPKELQEQIDSLQQALAAKRGATTTAAAPAPGAPAK